MIDNPPIGQHPKGTDRLPSVGAMVLLAVGMFLLALTSALVNEESQRFGGITILWLSNGLLLGVILCAPRRHWPALFAVASLGDFLVNIMLHTPVPLSIYYSACNMVEVAIAGFLLFPHLTKDPDLTEGRQLLAFLVYGTGVAPVVASLLAAFYLYGIKTPGYLHSMLYWFAGDVVGIATVTPLYLWFHHRKEFSRRGWVETWSLMTLVCGMAFAIFGQTRYPIVSLLMLGLLLLGVRLGFAPAALALLLVAFIGGHFTSIGLGPILLWPTSSLAKRELVLQAFLILMVVVLYVAEAVRSTDARLQAKLKASEARFRLIADTSRDMIVLANLDSTRIYVSAASREILGWEPEELLNRTYNQIVHAEDIEIIEANVQICREGRQSDVFCFRSRNKEGNYIWLEANLRLYRDEKGQPAGFVYSVRDISSRKALELERDKAFRMAEKRAMVDGLTGVWNRYMLDLTLEKVWQQGCEAVTPVSLLLIDVDHFKAYNDIYGHIAGDDCLRAIAKAIQAVLRRSSDLLARFGGEEFVVVLPETTSIGAELLCELVRQSIEEHHIPHTGSPYGFVTVSLGCATEIPMAGVAREVLMRAADEAMYRAKAAGRNQMRVSEGTGRISIV